MVAKGILSEAQLADALQWKQASNKRFGEVIVELGFVNESDVVRALAEQFDHAVLNVDDWNPSAQASSVVPEWFAVERLVLPVADAEDRVTVAMSDPLDVRTIDDLRAMVRKPVDVLLATATDLRRALLRAYAKETPAFEWVEPKPKAKRRAKPQKDRQAILDLVDKAAQGTLAQGGLTA